jgi:hypothetical protein
MGRFDVDREDKKHKGLVRFETRNRPGAWKEAKAWVDYAFALFASARILRPRSTGKGETGLELLDLD